MYNFLMKGGGWKHTRDSLALDRFYPPRDFPEFELVNGQPPAGLLKLPALLMPEVDSNAAQSAYVAKLTSIKIHRGVVHIEYKHNPASPLVVRDLMNLKAELEINTGGYALTHTHWSVKNVDLVAVLKKHGLLAARPLPKKKPSAAKIRTLVKANADQIVILTEALIQTIDEKLSQLRQPGPNDPDLIAERTTTISDYEALRKQVVSLRREIAKFQRSEISQVTAIATAQTFGSTIEKWWQKDSNRVLGHTANMGIILSVVGVGSLLGVWPQLTFAVSSALVGGKSAVDAIKAIYKR